MTVRIWGNPRTLSNSLFSKHNWKWVNLSIMAGFNVSLSLNERQSSSDKKHNKSLRLVLFIPFRWCFAGSLSFSLSTVKETKLFHSISEKLFTFLARKTLWVKLFSLNVWGVDKTRNMEHPGTFRNIPEHEKIKTFFYEKLIK